MAPDLYITQLGPRCPGPMTTARKPTSMRTTEADEEHPRARKNALHGTRPHRVQRRELVKMARTRVEAWADDEDNLDDDTGAIAARARSVTSSPPS